MHPADVAASMDAPNKFAQRTNRGFADATCNLVTGVMLPLEPNGHCNCTEGARTVLFGNSPRRPRSIKARAQARPKLPNLHILLGLAEAQRDSPRRQSYQDFMCRCAASNPKAFIPACLQPSETPARKRRTFGVNGRRG